MELRSRIQTQGSYHLHCIVSSEQVLQIPPPPQSLPRLPKAALGFSSSVPTALQSRCLPQWPGYFSESETCEGGGLSAVVPDGLLLGRG